ncbi:MAG: DUF2188 domain-containing protein [Actinobacteria bacterium]|nr:DUF2188 domain-containing protein [Actinomycetota bacterium]
MAQIAPPSKVKRVTDNDRYVVPNTRTGGWDIVKAGHRRATGHAKTMKEAITHARRAVRKDGGGELRIVNRAGKLTESNTIAPPKRRAA